MFLVLSRSRTPLVLYLPKRTHRSIAEVIEWDNHQWNPIDTPRRSQRTLRRINAGRATHGHTFVAPYYSSGSGLTGRSIDRPIGTISTIDRWAIIRGDRMRMLQPSEIRAAMGFRKDYVLPPTRREAIHLMGNAVCPVVATDLIHAIQRAA
jgi:DNA (cytosine-5)-methyltransferase 1